MSDPATLRNKRSSETASDLGANLGSLVLALVLLGPLASHAADGPDVTLEFAQCLREHDLHGDQARLKCYGAESKRQDRHLNDAYRKALARLPKAKAEELRKVQRLWLSYVDAKCGFLYDREEFNGTLAQVDAAVCAVSSGSGVPRSWKRWHPDEEELEHGN